MQRPADPTADIAYAKGRQAYYDEIRQHIAWATALYDGSTVTDLHPLYNEFPIWTANNSDRGSTTVDCFILHTQEGGGGDSAAEDLANYFNKPGVEVSYHYTISQASDGGVTVVDCVDTDRASWSVLSANSRSINLCFAGSKASWSQAQWMAQSHAIDVAAYLAVQDARKYGFALQVVPPPYTARIPGITDHRYVTKILGDGTHTDVGDNFPWAYFAERVKVWATGTPEPPAAQVFPDDWDDRALAVETLRQLRGYNLDGWPQLGGRSIVDYLAHLGQKIDALAASVDKLPKGDA